MRVWIGLIVCGFLAGGCGSEPITPRVVEPKVVRVELEIQLSSTEGSASSPITVTAIARNLGAAVVYGRSFVNCVCDGVQIDVLDPSGSPLLRIPCVQQPVCLCDRSPLVPGSAYERSQAFDGLATRIISLSPLECVQEQVASGEYTAVVRYSYHTDDGAPVRTLEQRAAFHWTGP